MNHEAPGCTPSAQSDKLHHMNPQLDPDSVFETCPECEPLVRGLRTLKSLERGSAPDLPLPSRAVETADLRKHLEAHRREKPHNFTEQATACAKAWVESYVAPRSSTPVTFQPSLPDMLLPKVNGILVPLHSRLIAGIAGNDTAILKEVAERLDKALAG